MGEGNGEHGPTVYCGNMGLSYLLGLSIKLFFFCLLVETIGVKGHYGAEQRAPGE